MEKCPNLKFCFAHGGGMFIQNNSQISGSFPYTLGRISHGFHVRPDLCQIDCKTDPRKFLGKFWVDSIVHDPLALEFLRNTVGDDKIVLGTDYPVCKSLREFITNQ